jgi:hypothetical protein
LRRPRPRRVGLALGVLLLISGVGVGLHAEASTRPNGWWEFMPTSGLAIAIELQSSDALCRELRTRQVSEAPRWARQRLLRRAAILITPSPTGAATPEPEASNLRWAVARVARADPELGASVVRELLREGDAQHELVALRTLLEIGAEGMMNDLSYEDRVKIIASQWILPTGGYLDPGFRPDSALLYRGNLDAEIASLVHDAVLSPGCGVPAGVALPFFAQLDPVPAGLMRDVVEAACATSARPHGVRTLAFRLVSSRGTGGADLVGSYLNDPDVETRLAAMMALAHFGADAEQYIDELEQTRRDPDHDVRTMATYTLYYVCNDRRP